MKATFIDDIFKDADQGFEGTSPLPAGTSQWSRTSDGKVSSILFICPCGCRRIRSVPVQPSDKGWRWNGDEAEPTLVPSILIVGECGWHGFLTKGEWRNC